MLEVFTKEGIDSQKAKDFIFHKTGMMPAIYDDGTHYVTNQKLTLETLKEISDSGDVLEVTGEYTCSIGGYGASHEHLDHKHTHDYYLSQYFSMTITPSPTLKRAASLIRFTS